jgi:hypothetical protein
MEVQEEGSRAERARLMEQRETRTESADDSFVENEMPAKFDKTFESLDADQGSSEYIPIAGEIQKDQDEDLVRLQSVSFFGLMIRTLK